MRPPVPYFGGKQRIADQIVSLFPQHDHYVEPFAGGLSILLSKEPSKIETINDLDQDVMTFWRVLRDQPDALMATCALTPHSRSEYREASSREALTDLERARRIWVQLTQGRTGTLRKTGWRYHADPDGTSMGMPAYLNGYLSRMPPAAHRLREVSLECRPALEVIADYGKHENCLLYVDPPYLRSTRSGMGYQHEMPDEAEHRLLAEALRSCRAKVVLSGYASDLYGDLYADWTTHHISASTGQGSVWKERSELCWMNFEHEHLFSEVTA